MFVVVSFCAPFSALSNQNPSDVDNKEQSLITKALTDKTPQAEYDCWVHLRPSILKLKEMYEYSKAINEVLTKVFEAIWPDLNDEFTDVAEMILTNHQALVKQFAKILSFVLEFDEVKMTTTGIQNDFSYYRRVMLRLINLKNNKYISV